MAVVNPAVTKNDPFASRAAASWPQSPIRSTLEGTAKDSSTHAEPKRSELRSTEQTVPRIRAAYHGEAGVRHVGKASTRPSEEAIG
ncbi:MAG: hypothetical protein MUC96_03185 [Myxococcaceae bacterium]|nr:hypothetical protein [Myxococcaceae bacterium]